MEAGGVEPYKQHDSVYMIFLELHHSEGEEQISDYLGFGMGAVWRHRRGGDKGMCY